MSSMNGLNPRTTSLPIGWHDDDPNVPEVPGDLADDPAMRVLLAAKMGLPFVRGEDDLARWVLTLAPEPDGSWNGWMADARLRVRILTALGVGYGAVPLDPENGRCYSRPSSDRMVLDRAIDWLHTELLAGSR